jgi:hypothetical protein
MRKNYFGVSAPYIKGLKFYCQDVFRKMSLTFSIGVVALSNPLHAQCPTVEGTLSTEANSICKNTKPHDIILAGYSGNIIKWQSASNLLFTNDLTDIPVTSPILTGNLAGPLSTTTYFRAVVQMEGCTVENTAPLTITISEPVIYSNGTWSSTPNETTPVIISANLTLSANLKVCSCEVINGATLTIPAQKSLTLCTSLAVDAGAHVVVDNKGTLLQLDDAAENTGNVDFKIHTTPMRQYDYNYWSAPVSAMTLLQLSPNTLFDKFYSFDATTNSWVMHPNGAAVMQEGKGYIVRAPQGWNQTNGTQGIFEATFIGTPVNGIVPVDIKKGTGSFSLIGNPYPSAIDLDLFLTDPANEGLINGTVYMWTHNTAISNAIPGNALFNYTRDDYSKYNMTGGVATASPSLSGSIRPTSILTSGQAYFVEAHPDLPQGTYTAYFKNDMRTENYVGTNNRLQPDTTASVEKDRIWVNIANTDGAYDELLLGYISGATNDLDRKYDGKTFPAGNVVSIYSILGANELSIQGRALPFSPSDIIPIGFNTTLTGTFTISLGQSEGLFTGQDVYILDKNTGGLHDLQVSSYSFTTEAGIFNDRFELRFADNSLSVGDVTIAKPEVIIGKIGNEVSVRSLNGILKTVKIYDLAGRLLYQTENIHDNTFQTTGIRRDGQFLLVKAILENNIEASGKVILN